jgi:hypothetical protein
MDPKGLVASLFDLSFSHFITPKIQRFLYVLLLAVSALAGLGTLATALGMGGGFLGKMGALIVGVPVAGLVFLLLAMYFRVMMEILIVVFRGVEYLAEIAAATKSSAGMGRSGS